jgi:hypothetical protein
MLDRAVISLDDSVTVKVLVKNEGPDSVMAGIPCPSFAVRDTSFARVGPHVGCLAVIPRWFNLPAGDSIVTESIWTVQGLTGGHEGLYTIWSAIGTTGIRYSDSALIQINQL